METSLLSIRDQQKATWNKFSSGWKKWDNWTMSFLWPMGEAIIGALQLNGDEHVLDIATGTGEPGLTIASMLPTGMVTATDLSDSMLGIASENAEHKGLKNFETVACDACELPFPDNSFDAISCRMGFMFFPDMAVAAKEMLRVLRPGGRLATSVWAGPEGNPWITTMTGVMKNHMEMPAPPAGSPGMFRCAAPGAIAKLLQEAGLKQTEEHVLPGKVHFADEQEYWRNMNEVVAPVVSAMSNADDATKSNIQQDLNKVLMDMKESDGLNIPFAAIIISGVK